jgi:thermolysin metallopeptidase-like protein
METEKLPGTLLPNPELSTDPVVIEVFLNTNMLGEFFFEIA